MDGNRASELAGAVRRGDHEAFRLLVDGLTRGLIARAYRYTGDWEAARDLAQDTWLTVHEQIRRYDTERPFLPWLWTLHRNGCVSWLRRAAARRELAVDEGALAAAPAAAAESDPSAGVAQREFFERLQRAIGRLSPGQRRVFALVDIEHTEQEEAARLLRMKFTTLRSTLHFARRRLAALLGGREES